MNKYKTGWLAALALITGIANAMDGNFDRTAEVDRYVTALKDANHGTSALIAREIYGSGIMDPRLAAALSEKLLREYKHLAGKREDQDFGVFMVRALASCGVADYASTLKQVASGSTNEKTRSAAAKEMNSIEWHHGKNIVMAGMQNYRQGDDANVSRLMNLLQSDDYTYKHWAVERMNWDKVLDARLMTVIAQQVQSYADHGGGTLTDIQDDTLANFVKMLGYSKDVQYRPLLEKVSTLSHASSSVKRYSKSALAKL